MTALTPLDLLVWLFSPPLDLTYLGGRLHLASVHITAKHRRIQIAGSNSILYASGASRRGKRVAISKRTSLTAVSSYAVSTVLYDALAFQKCDGIEFNVNIYVFLPIQCL